MPLLKTAGKLRDAVTLCVLFACMSFNAAASPARQTAPGLAGLPFIANQGQLDDLVAYYARMPTATIFVTKAGQVVYSLAGGERPGGQAGWTLTETFSDDSREPSGLQPARTSVS